MLPEYSRIARASAWAFLFLSLAASVRAQQTAPGKTSPEFPDEPLVIERSSAEFKFEKDGTSTQDTRLRVRIQSQAGLQQLGVIHVAYASATGTMQIVSVRVLKADGRVVPTPPENVLEMPADITRQAPLYSDLKEKQVAVKGLEIGDVLEYEYREQVTTPLSPGHFWLAYNFVHDAITLEESLQISVPREMYTKVQSKDHPPVVSDQGAYRLYSWKVSNLKIRHDDKKTPSAEKKEPELPSVQLTTFRTWEEVGDWFRGLIAPRVAPTPEIRAKAEQLTRGAATDAQKVQAIYDFVSTKFRYVGVSLGIGRYQPHPASEVLTNDYGDCKDKHTLLASLLSAVGVKVYPALVNTAVALDPDTPSPNQFDHLISAWPQQQGFQWLDSTLEVAPLGYIIPNLREKQALLIPESGPSRLVSIPADLPFPSTFDFQMQGALNDQGTFQGQAEIVTRGDFELLLRSALRSTPQARWQEVVQAVSASLSFGGDVSDVSADPPDSTHTPFHLRYRYSRKEFGDWANGRILAAVPLFYLPEPPSESAEEPDPVVLGTLTESRFHCSMKLPAGSHMLPPSNLKLKEEFATYDSVYSVAESTLIVERVLRQTARKILPAQFPAYRKFRQAILDEEQEFLSLNAVDSGANAAEKSVRIAPSADPEASALAYQGSQAMLRGDFPAAAGLFQKSVEKDPQYGAAWVSLGIAHVSQGSVRNGVAEMTKGIALDHGTSRQCKLTALRLEKMGLLSDALDLWRAIDQADVADKDAPMNIGEILLSQHHYAEALPELERGAARNPSNSRAQYVLGSAYLHVGDQERAISRFHLAVQTGATPDLLNAIAYTMAENSIRLEEALQYAQQAVAAVEKRSTEISLDNVEPQDLRTMVELGAYWDTLGWVQFRLGRLDLAEKYLTAGWDLTQLADIGDHLGHLYEQQHRKREAIAAYARALAAGRPPDSSHARLVALQGSDALAQKTIDAARGELGQLRAVKVSGIGARLGSAEFFVLLDAGPQPPQVRFLSGPESMRGATDAIQSAKYDVRRPDDAPVKILRRGILACDSAPAGCIFVLIPPAAVVSTH